MSKIKLVMPLDHQTIQLEILRDLQIFNNQINLSNNKNQIPIKNMNQLNLTLIKAKEKNKMNKRLKSSKNQLYRNMNRSHLILALYIQDNGSMDRDKVGVNRFGLINLSMKGIG